MTLDDDGSADLAVILKENDLEHGSKSVNEVNVNLNVNLNVNVNVSRRVDMLVRECELRNEIEDEVMLFRRSCSTCRSTDGMLLFIL